MKLVLRTDLGFACGEDGRGQQERHSMSAVICNYTRDPAKRKESALYTKQDIPVILENIFFPYPLILNIRPKLFMQVPQCIFNHETN